MTKLSNMTGNAISSKGLNFRIFTQRPLSPTYFKITPTPNSIGNP
jgi:hypothetical protein